MVLVDSSIWIEVFRRHAPLDIEAYAQQDEWVTCLPVIQELLQGFREEKAYRCARDALFSMPIVESPLSAERFIEGASLFRAARRVGLTPRSSTDCLIAACALHHDLPVLHRDRDFDLLAQVSPLRTLSPPV